MKDPDSSLDRLLRAASQHQPLAPDAAGNEEPPFGFATRVIAGWRTGGGRERHGLELVWFRRSLLCALAVMAISVGWSFKMDTTPANDEVAIAYDANADIP